MKVYVYESIDARSASNELLLEHYICMAKCISSVLRSNDAVYHTDFSKSSGIVVNDNVGPATLHSGTTLDTLERRLPRLNVSRVGGKLLFKNEEGSITGYIKQSSRDAGIKLLGISKEQYYSLKDNLTAYAVKRAFI